MITCYYLLLNVIFFHSEMINHLIAFFQMMSSFPSFSYTNFVFEGKMHSTFTYLNSFSLPLKAMLCF